MGQFGLVVCLWLLFMMYVLSYGIAAVVITLLILVVVIGVMMGIKVLVNSEHR